MNAPRLEPVQIPQVQTSVNCHKTAAPCATAHVITSTPPASAWRCVHGGIVVPPAAPEILASDNGCGLCIQWPTVVHATAYAVEILNQKTMTAQRYLHAAPAGTLPFVMDFRT